MPSVMYPNCRDMFKFSVSLAGWDLIVISAGSGSRCDGSKYNNLV